MQTIGMGTSRGAAAQPTKLRGGGYIMLPSIFFGNLLKSNLTDGKVVGCF